MVIKRTIDEPANKQQPPDTQPSPKQWMHFRARTPNPKTTKQ